MINVTRQSVSVPAGTHVEFTLELPLITRIRLLLGWKMLVRLDDDGFHVGQCVRELPLRDGYTRRAIES
jgi:hypothetical protein